MFAFAGVKGEENGEEGGREEDVRESIRIAIDTAFDVKQAGGCDGYKRGMQL